jgi:hypothetical protein
MSYTVTATNARGTQSKTFTDKDRALLVAESAWEVYGGDVEVVDENGDIIAEFES